jgi:2-polyprenyl-6-methoxyphenol hydroxylase-like FAD-dependent oxidoreductase
MNHDQVIDSAETTCCVVGAGPGGAILALMLARQNIPVVLLEAQDDFDRDFRGDTIHPSVLYIMEELGLIEDLLKMRHSKIHTFGFSTPDGVFTVADFRRFEPKYPYIMMVPQEHFLAYVTEQAKKYPNFKLLMGARVQELIQENGVTCGVRYRDRAGTHELRALLTVGADGRSSAVRRLAGIEPTKTSPPMDILWFRIPRDEQNDPSGALGHFGRGHALALLDRLDQWQVGYVIMKGSYSEVRSAGLEALRASIREMMTEFPDRIDHLKDWKQVAVLSVESSRVPQWYQPGLLLIGDAAHVMSPVGGVGINYAIQDGVAAANVLTGPLKYGAVSIDDLREVQNQREFAVKFIQWFQMQAQKNIIAAALRSDRPMRIPTVLQWLLKIPYIRDLPGKTIAYGIRTVHVEKQR